MDSEQKRKLIEFSKLNVASLEAEIAFHQAKISLLSWRLHEEKTKLQLILMRPSTRKLE